MVFFSKNYQMVKPLTDEERMNLIEQDYQPSEVIMETDCEESDADSPQRKEPSKFQPIKQQEAAKRLSQKPQSQTRVKAEPKIDKQLALAKQNSLNYQNQLKERP